MRGKMELRNIQTFIKAADLGSFTNAAAEMNYAQSTVTMQIQQLEKELGFPLFDRIGTKVSLTAPGHKFLSYAKEIVHIMQEAGTLGKDPGCISGSLRIGVLESLLFGTLMELLPGYKAEYPLVDIQIKMGQAADLLVMLKQNQLDMVYLSANLRSDPDLHCCYKRKENLVFLASPDHCAARQKKIPLQEVLKYNFLVTEHSGVCYGRMQELAARCNMSLTHSLTVDSTIVIAALVQKGMGLAFLPEYSVAKQLKEGSLVKLDVDLEPQIYYSQIFCHKDRWIAPFMEGLIGKIKEAMPIREDVTKGEYDVGRML